MRILLIDNTVEPASHGSEELRRYLRKAPGATLCTRRAPEGDLPASPDGYDRVVASGSATDAREDAPWIERLLELTRRTLDAGKPFLGVCFGHQMLARALGGKSTVGKGAEAEYGWARIEVLEDAPLLKGMPRAFHSFAAHFDEVTRLPDELRLLARSEACPVQACQVDGRPAYGIQFHPEKDLVDAKKTFEERRRKGTPRQLLHPERSRELYDPGLADTLFRNFLEL